MWTALGVGPTSGDAGSIVIGEIHARYLRIPIVLALVGNHCVADTLHITVIARVIRAGGDFSNMEKLVGDVRKLRSRTGGRCSRGYCPGTSKGECTCW